MVNGIITRRWDIPFDLELSCKLSKRQEKNDIQEKNSFEIK